MDIVIRDFGVSISKKGNRIVISQNQNKIEHHVKDIQNILLLNPGNTISTAAIRLALKNDISVIFGKISGNPIGVIVPTVDKKITLRRKQYACYDTIQGSEIIKNIIHAKICNQISVLRFLKNNRKLPQPAIQNSLKRILKIIKTLENISGPPNQIRFKLMGVEGNCSHAYWSGISSIIPKRFGFSGRVKRGASDPINVMLNFGYSAILYPICYRELFSCGLEPTVGILHADIDNRASLVYDFIEQFRQPLVDRAVIKIVTRKLISNDKILNSNNYLTKDAIRIIYDVVNERLYSNISYKQKNLTLSNIIGIESKKLACSILDGTRYIPIYLR